MEVGIHFSNQLDFPVKVYWINFQGRRQKKFELDPREEKKWNTYVGCVWLITDRDGKALNYFVTHKVGVGKKRHGLALIRPENLPAE